MTYSYKIIEKPVAWNKLPHWMWPEFDEKLFAVFDSVSDLDSVLHLVKSRKVCVQAGGAVGVWPLRLSSEFDWVYTYEPHPQNFRCLMTNCFEVDNVIAQNAAIGEKFGRISLTLMDHEENNHGAFQVSEAAGLTGKVIPITMIDALRLPECGLIYLDIEGMEKHALTGAEETIKRCRPVIAVEDKGLSEIYGSHKGDLENWLITEHNYRVVARPHRDVILVPND